MFEMLLGHFVADYLLQSKNMAMLKSRNTIEGWYTCICHCIIYTATVCLFMGIVSPWWIVIVFASHFFIDKFSLGDVWLKMIEGRSLTSTVEEYHTESSDLLQVIQLFKVAFSTLVYTIVDNTMHIFLMWIGYKLLFGGV